MLYTWCKCSVQQKFTTHWVVDETKMLKRNKINLLNKTLSLVVEYGNYGTAYDSMVSPVD